MASPGVATDDEPTVLSNWAFMRIGGTLLLCTQGTGSPSDPDFEVWLERLGRGDVTKILIHSRGCSPSAKQRTRIKAHWTRLGQKPPRVALLTDSAASRAILTALEWFLKDAALRALPLDAVEAGLQWLEEPTAHHDVVERIQSMQATLTARTHGTRTEKNEQGAKRERA